MAAGQLPSLPSLIESSALSGPRGLESFKSYGLCCLRWGQVKEHFRVLLLRVDASLRGVQSSLPDFQLLSEDKSGQSLTVAGAAGASVRSTSLREKTADVLHTKFR
jgi:hypothetical protein